MMLPVTAARTVVMIACSILLFTVIFVVVLLGTLFYLGCALRQILQAPASRRCTV